jgi:UDP-N-acetyl-D-mannosaminuronic acid dehydrogenase
LDTISIIGIGRVGLPLSLSFAAAGFKVHGVDKDPALVQTLVSGKMPFMEMDAARLLESVINKSFFPMLDSSCLASSETVIITLGTPVDENLNPDYSQLRTVLPSVCRHLKNDQLIVLRSTVSPGTTEYVKDLIEEKTGKVCGKDFYLAYCPERIAEGYAIQEIKDVPQIIGGIDDPSSERAEALFSRITKKCLLTDPRSAELAKLFSNMYRYINFAIANEFAMIAMQNGRQIHEITRLVNEDYKRGGLAGPGFAAGPCLYKDGFFLVNKIPFNELISASWRINENLPLYLLDEIKRITDLKGKKVALLGMSFKKNIDDTRNSLSFKLKNALLIESCRLTVHDPFVEEFKGDLIDAVKGADVLIIAVNHDDYRILDTEMLKRHMSPEGVVCDIWNMTGNSRIIYRL